MDAVLIKAGKTRKNIPGTGCEFFLASAVDRYLCGVLTEGKGGKDSFLFCFLFVGLVPYRFFLLFPAGSSDVR